MQDATCGTKIVRHSRAWTRLTRQNIRWIHVRARFLGWGKTRRVTLLERTSPKRRGKERLSLPAQGPPRFPIALITPQCLKRPSLRSSHNCSVPCLRQSHPSPRTIETQKRPIPWFSKSWATAKVIAIDETGCMHKADLCSIPGTASLACLAASSCPSSKVRNEQGPFCNRGADFLPITFARMFCLGLDIRCLGRGHRSLRPLPYYIESRPPL